MKNKIILLFTMLLLLTLGATPLKAQDLLTICNGTETNTTLPVYGYYLDVKQRTQMFYPANLLTDMQGGEIKSMTFYSSTTSTSWSGTINVSLATTTSNLTSGFLTASFTQVCSAVLRVVNNQLVVTFTTPFLYEGDNLLIQFDQPTAATWVSATFEGQMQSIISGREQHGTNYNTSSSNNASSFLPKVTFEYEVTGACVKPSDLTQTNVNTTSAAYSWTAGGEETEWLVEYGTKGFAQGTGTITSVNTTNATLNGLSANTEYDLYVRAVCGAGDTSRWITTSFMTPQITLEVPFTCDFEDDVQNSMWQFANLTNATANNWYIDTAENHGGQKSLYISNNGGASNAYSSSSAVATVWAYRDIHFSNDAEFELGFDWKCKGEAAYDFMFVFIGDIYTTTATATNTRTPTMTNAVRLTNPLQGSYHFFSAADGADTLWNAFKMVLDDSYANQTKRVYFGWTNDNTGGNQPPVAVDNFYVSAFNCARVQNLQLVNFVDDEITVKWDAFADASGYQAVITDDREANPNSLAASAFTVNDTNYTFTGLTPSTTYYIYVRSTCGTEHSAWSSSLLTVTTSQVPLETPFVETFENDATNAYWQFANNNYLHIPNNWYIDTAVNNGGLKSLYISNDGGETNAYTTASAVAVVWAYRDIYFTPAESYQLSFDWKGAGQGTVDFMRAYIGGNAIPKASTVSTTITTPTNSSSIYNSQTGNVYFNQNNTWTTSVVDIDPQYAGTTQRLYFVWANNQNGGTQPPIAIDNIKVTSSNCPEVDNAVFADFSDNSFTISMECADGNVSQGYDIAYATTDGNPDSMSIVSVTDTFAVVGGLTPMTTYYVYVRTNCGSGDVGFWNINPLTITTRQTPLVVPFLVDFEDDTENARWQLVNNTNLTSYPNAWYIGTAVNHGGLKSLYISKDGGATNSYAITTSHIVWAYRDVYFPTAGDYTISFDWKCFGEGSSDYMYVFIGDEVNVTASGGIYSSPSVTGAYQFQNPLRSQNYFNGYSQTTYTMKDTNWNHFELTLSPTLCNQYAGTYKRLYFAWKNDASSGTQPPMALDNIAITATSCLVANAPTVITDSTTETTAMICWTPRGTESEWIVEYKLTSDTTWTQATATNDTTTLTGLMPSSTYDVRIIAVCGEDDASIPSASAQFKTACGQITTFPWTYGFEEDWVTTPNRTAPYCWHNLDGQSSYYYWQRTTSASNVNSGYGAAYFYGTSSSTYTNEDRLVLPSIVFDATPKQIRFFAKKYSASYHPRLTLQVATFDGTNFGTWRTVNSVVVDDVNYQEYTISLADLAGINYYYLAFARVDTANYNLYLDDIVIEDIPACPRPNAISFANTNHEQTTMSWAMMGGNTDAQYVISTTANADPDTLTPVNVTGTSATITGLTLRTTYYVWMRTNCGGTYSDWTLPASFTTTAIVAQLPYFCDFEEATEANQWETYSTTTNKWMVGTATSSSTSHALYVSDDNASHNYATGTTANIWAYRDIQFPTNAAQFELSFDWKGYGESGYDYMKVYIGDAVTITSSTNVSTGPTGATNFGGEMKSQTAWTSSTFTLGATYAGTTKRLYFGWRNDGSGGLQPPAAVDNISITPIYCSAPTALTVPATTLLSNSAVLNWTAGSDETSWIVEYCPANSSTWLSDTVTATTHTLTGLTPSTTYQVRVYAICANGEGTSAATSTVSFFTACNVITNLPYFYDFEDTWVQNGTRPAPPCWENKDDGDSYYWYSSTSGYGGSKAAYFYGTNGTSTMYADYLFSPQIVLTGNQRLSIYLKRSTGTYNPTLQVYLFTDPSDPNPIMVQSITNIPTDYQEFVVDLSTYSGTYHVGLGRNDNGNLHIFADNFLVEDVPACEKPMALTVNGVRDNTATISWQVLTPTTDSYIFAFESTPNFDPDTCQNVATFSTLDTFYTFPAGTFQPVTTYYGYLKAICGSDESIWTLTPITFTTSQIPLVAPCIEDFENAGNNAMWQFANNTSATANNWYIGTAINNGGSHALYISNNGGTTNAYSNTSNCVVWAYRDVYFADAADYALSFDWRCRGESSYDYMRVFVGDIQNVTALTTTSLVVPTNTVAIQNPFRTSNTTYFNGYDGSDYTLENTWHRTEATLEGDYTGQTKRIYFAWINDGSQGEQAPIAVDNIQFTAYPCMMVDSLRVIDSLTTTNTATIQWHQRGSETAWFVEYALAVDTNYTRVAANTNPFQLTGLQGGSSYNVRVIANCGDSSQSLVSQPINFRTECDIIANFPWTYTFNETWDNQASPLTRTAPYCWYNLDGASTSYYYSYSSSSGLNGSGAAYFNTYSTNAANDWLITPVFALTGNEQLSFYAKKTTASYMPELTVFTIPEDSAITSATTIAAAATLRGNVILNADHTNYVEYVVDLSADTGNYRIGIARLDAVGTSHYIDNLTIEPIPSCVKPISLVVSNIGGTSVDFSWGVRGDTAQAYEIVINAVQNFSPDTATTNIYSFTGTTGTITGLLPLTTYTAYVRANCGPDGYSVWNTIPVTFTTVQSPLIVPFFEEFEDSANVSMWQFANNTADNKPNRWYIGNAVNNGGLASLYISADGGATNTYVSSSCGVWAYRDVYFTPAGEYEVTFDWQCYGSSTQDFMRIYVGDPVTPTPYTYQTTSPSLTGASTYSVVNDLRMSNIYYFNAYDGSGYNNTGWNTTTFTLDGSYSGKTKRFYFYWTNNTYTPNPPAAAVDNFSISPVNCVRPTNIVVSNAGPDAVTISWTPAADEEEFQVYYSTDPNFFNDTVTGNLRISVNDTFVTISGLQPTTNYYLDIRAICSETAHSQWTDRLAFSTTQIPAQLPYIEDFEATTTDWQFANLTGTNANGWYVGRAIAHTGLQSLYISNDDGVTRGYTNNVAGYVWAYRDIAFNVEGDYDLSFDWTCHGEIAADYMRAYLAAPSLVTAAQTSSSIVPPANALAFVNPLRTSNTYLFNGYDGSAYSLDTVWNHFSTTLPNNLNGTTQRLYFVWRNDGSVGVDPIVIDNVNINVNTCLAVDSLHVAEANITPNTALVEWTARGEETAWNLEYKLVTDTVWTSVLATTPSYQLTGLLAAADYDVRVQAACDMDATSRFVATSFRTLCDIITQLPWVEDFNSGAWETSLDGDLAPLCWNQIANDDSYYFSRNSSSGLNSTGCAYYSGSTSAYTNNSDWLITPYFNLPGNERVVFSAKAASTTYAPLVSVYALTSNRDITTALFIDSVRLTSTTFQEFTMPIAPLAGTYAIAFVRNTVGAGSFYIDDVTVEPIPSCERPNSVAVSGITQDAATVTWVSVADNETGYEIAYSTDPNFDPDTCTNTIVLTSTATSYTFPAGTLMASTTYYLYVKTICGAADESFWSRNVVSFQTQQIPLQVPFVIDFEDATQAACWGTYNVDNHQWIVGTATASSPTHALYISGDGVSYHSDYTYWADEGTLWAYRDITFPTGADAFTLSFDWKCVGTIEDWYDYYYYDYDSYQLDALNVFIGPIQAIDGTIDGSDNSGPANSTQLVPDMLLGQSTWTTFTTQLGAQYAGTTQRLYFAWYHDYAESDGYDYYSDLEIDHTYGDPAAVDNISISVECSDVTGLTVTPDSTSAEVTWSGTASSYEVEYGAAGFTQGSGTVATTTATNFTITGLTPSTGYDVYVRVICGEDIYSDAVMANFTTLDGDEPGPGPGPGPGGDDTTGIRDIDLIGSVTLAPNPTHDNLYVKTTQRFNQVEILNQVGQIIYRAEVLENNFVIDVTPYSSGIYFLRLTGTEGVVTKRFSKN